MSQHVRDDLADAYVCNRIAYGPGVQPPDCEDVMKRDSDVKACALRCMPAADVRAVMSVCWLMCFSVDSVCDSNIETEQAKIPGCKITVGRVHRGELDERQLRCAGECYGSDEPSTLIPAVICMQEKCGI